MADVDPAVAEADRKAAEEMDRFRAALPRLLEDASLRGRWVVFKDGRVFQSFERERRTDAHRWAVEHLGRLAGFIIAPVEPRRIYRIGLGPRVVK